MTVVKRVSVFAVPLLLVGLLTGCGGDGSSAAAPDEPRSAATGGASDEAEAVTAFCNVIVGIIQQAPQGASDAEALQLLKRVAAQFEQVGAPSDMPEDARRALQVAIDKINALPDDATADEVSRAARDLTAAQQEDQAALGEYVQEKCLGGLTPSAGSSPSNG